MAKTYDPTLGTDKDRVRLRIDDTNRDEKPMVLEDEEIEGTIVTYGTVEGAARLCETLGLYWSKRADDMSDGDTKTKYTNRSKAYFEQAENIRTNMTDHAPEGSAVSEIVQPDMTQMRTD